jgi:hypothetical protein
MPTVQDDSRFRLLIAGIFLSGGTVFLALFYFILRFSGLVLARFIGNLLLGADPTANDILPFPFTIQVATWLVFFFGLGELYQRRRSTRREAEVLGYGLLPEDEQTILLADDVGALYRKVRQALHNDDDTFLYRLIQRIAFQFQSSQSVDQANSLLNSSLELFNHEVDLRYGLLR